MQSRHRAILAEGLATGLWVGWFPIAPGTVGSLWGIVARLALDGRAAWVGLAILTGCAVWASQEHDRLSGTHDCGRIVIDEVVGMWLTTLWFPATLGCLLASFLLFRIWDVLKPWPIGRSQDLPGGWGVVIDDVLAGGLSAVCVALLRALGVL